MVFVQLVLIDEKTQLPPRFGQFGFPSGFRSTFAGLPGTVRLLFSDDFQNLRQI
jgi:hypothetical protein